MLWIRSHRIRMEATAIIYKRGIRVKRKLLIIAASLVTLLLFAGCSDYGEIERELDEIKIENKLPKVGREKYRTMEEAEDAVYAQQLAACEMLSDAAEQTDSKQFEEYDGTAKRIAERCNDKRNEIALDIKDRYTANVYEIMEDVKDCPNVDAYVAKTYLNVETFYDEYHNYQTADNTDMALTDILVYYYDRTNVLAKSFLTRNESDVYDASVAVIEGNAQAEDDYRFYINKNNLIIKALNEIYGGVSAEYAQRINEAGNKLARNLLDSLSSLSDRERKLLMEEMGLVTPTPAPTEKPTPKPSATPSATAVPKPTATAEPRPAPTQRPAATPRPATPKPAATQKPQAPADQDTEEQFIYELD